ncbi:tetratricopeptide repeat protein [Elusimicrobiota bacterium]
MNTVRNRQKVFWTVLGLILSALLLEIGLRIGGYVSLFPGEQRYISLSEQKDKYRILCLGECMTESQWTDLLQEKLDLEEKGRFSVINKGIGATNTGAILLKFRQNIEKYRPHMIISMMGVNDNERSIIVPVNPFENKTMFSIIKSLEIYKLARLIKWSIFKKIKAENKRNNYKLTDYARQKAIEEESRNKSTKYLEMGQDYEREEKYREAEEAFKKALSLSPKDLGVYAQLGQFYTERGKSETGERFLEKAIAIDPENANLHIQLGRSFVDQKKYKKAKKSFKAALLIDPYNEYATDGLISIHQAKLCKEISEGEDRVVFEYYNQNTSTNLRKLKKIAAENSIQLVFVQYPMRRIEPLKKMLEPYDGISFVDNEKSFKDAVNREGYDKYFVDRFAVDFGHFTEKGSRLLAENIAGVILDEVTKTNDK